MKGAGLAARAPKVFDVPPSAARAHLSAPMGDPLIHPFIELAAVVVGGLSGALIAERKGFDAIGVLALATVGGLGGGMIRDVLLQQGPPIALTDPWLLGYVLVSTLIGFLVGSRVTRFARVLLWVDAASLAFFTVAGASKSLAAGLPAVSAALLGVITSVGGGALRDVLAGEPPSVFFSGELYATVAIAGGGLYVGLRMLGVSHADGGAVAIALMIVLRLVAVRYGWKAPLPLGSKSRYGR